MVEVLPRAAADRKRQADGLVERVSPDRQRFLLIPEPLLTRLPIPRFYTLLPSPIFGVHLGQPGKAHGREILVVVQVVHASSTFSSHREQQNVFRVIVRGSMDHVDRFSASGFMSWGESAASEAGLLLPPILELIRGPLWFLRIRFWTFAGARQPNSHVPSRALSPPVLRPLGSQARDGGVQISSQFFSGTGR